MYEPIKKTSVSENFTERDAVTILNVIIGMNSDLFRPDNVINMFVI